MRRATASVFCAFMIAATPALAGPREDALALERRGDAALNARQTDRAATFFKAAGERYAAGGDSAAAARVYEKMADAYESVAKKALVATVVPARAAAAGGPIAPPRGGAPEPANARRNARVADPSAGRVEESGIALERRGDAALAAKQALNAAKLYEQAGRRYALEGSAAAALRADEKEYEAYYEFEGGAARQGPITTYLRETWHERAQAQVRLDMSQRSANTASPLRGGTYNCIAGFGTMLTLGKATIQGFSYRFQPPSGPGSAGTYSIGPAGIHWNGDIGAIRNGWVRESGKEASNSDVFWFKYRVPGSSGEQTASCHRQ